jgi:uncharacterized protein
MIHKFTQNGFNILLDVNSGAVHLIDNATFELLDHIKLPLTNEYQKIAALEDKYSEVAMKEAYFEIYDLFQDGELFSEDYYIPINTDINSPIKAMCLHIAHDCNLRCAYCFASTGDFGQKRTIMPLEIGIKAIDFLLQNSGERHNLELDFFGGEPLMNFEVVKSIVKYAREKEKEYNKKFRFTITTNGLLLDDDKTDFINREMSNVVLSIDGRKEVNDKVRKRIDNSGCYDSILPKFKNLVEKRNHNNYYVRGTFTNYNLDFTEDVKHLKALGFDQISVEPVVSEKTKEYAITEQHLPAIFDEYEKLAKETLRYKKEGRGFNFFHFMLDLEQGPCAIKRMRGCGCGNEYVAVTPDGDIYPCHQFVGQDEYLMGNVVTGDIDIKLKKKFSKANIYTKEECNKCWVKFYCSGGCNANNSIYEGDILKPHKISCEIERKRVECAIMIKAALT